MEDPISQHGPAADSSRVIIVVVGDDAVVRDLVATVLRGAGHVVHDGPEDAAVMQLAPFPQLVVAAYDPERTSMSSGREGPRLPPSLDCLPLLALRDPRRSFADASTGGQALLLRHVELLSMATAAAHPAHPAGVVDLSAVLRESLQLATHELAQADVVCEFDTQLRVVAHPEHLRLIFRTLLIAAAARLALDGPSSHGVRVAGWRTAEGRTIVEISDTGKRIEPDQLARLFDAHDRSTHDATELDLATSRRIVHAGGGHMSVRSSAGGTSFRVAMPTANAQV